MTDHDHQINLQAEVSEELAGKRLDQIAAKMFPEYSRARLQQWIRSGELLVDGQVRRPRDNVEAGARLVVNTVLADEGSWEAEPLALDIIFEDEQLLVLNKAAGTVVHPAAGHREGTLLNGLLSHCPSLAKVPRAGIVHRLDKDTTGLMVVAKTLSAHSNLVQQLQARSVKREYEAVVKGVLTGGGSVDQPLGRHPVNRKKQAVLASGKEAITHFRVVKRFRCHTHTAIQLETGRTHQIRVHMAHIGHALVGDQVYGGRLQLPAACHARLEHSLRQFKRQALHARRLTLVLPDSGETRSWEVPLPEDLVELLQAMALDLDSMESGSE